jgi:hypothetical protein
LAGSGVVFEDILYAAADAGVNYLKALGLATLPAGNVYAGVRHDATMATTDRETSIRLTPRAEVIARHAGAIIPTYSGTWDVELSVSVISNYSDTTAAAHRARVNEIFSALNVPTLAEDLSAASPCLFVPVVVPLTRETEVQGKLITDTLVLELRHACVDRDTRGGGFGTILPGRDVI